MYKKAPTYLGLFLCVELLIGFFCDWVFDIGSILILR
jgi:hypothetical protein